MLPMATAPASDYTVDSAAGKITQDAQLADDATYETPKGDDATFETPKDDDAKYETPKGDDVSSPSTFEPNYIPIINKNRMTLMPQ